MRWIGRHAHGSESEVIAHGRPTCSQRTGPTELHHFVVRRACAIASALFPHAYLTVNREAALMRELVNSRVVGNPEVMWHVPRGGDCVQLVYKKAGLKGLKMDLSNAESTTDS